MSQEVEYQTERLDHLGIVAGVCQEAGIAEWLDKQAGESRRSVSVGKATVAMVLNGLGFSNRQLYLVPQFFANKPVEHLLGAGITAEITNFVKLTVYRDRKESNLSFRSKGHAEQMGAWVAFLKGNIDAPLPYEESRASMLLTFAVLDSIQQGRAVDFSDDGRRPQEPSLVAHKRAE